MSVLFCTIYYHVYATYNMMLLYKNTEIIGKFNIVEADKTYIEVVDQMCCEIELENI